MTETQQGTSDAFRETRPLALAFTILLLTYAVVGGAAGVLWLIDLANKLVNGPPPSKPYITVWSVNLLFAPIALVGGVLALGYVRAAGSGDLERASVAWKRLCRWAVVAAIVLLVYLAGMFVAAVLTGEFPG